MLVIISDLHLTDGSSGETINERAFRIFRQDLNDLAYEASWRAAADPAADEPRMVYDPITELDVILLGDILDVIRSTAWLDDAGGIRPWTEPRGKDFEALVARISAGILTRNASSLQILRDLTVPTRFTLPPAINGKPGRVSHEVDGPGRVPVQVRLHYLVGNHDWMYHLAGPAYDTMRAVVVAAMGLSNDPQVPFPHDPSESPVIAGVMAKHQVFARHGDIHDRINYEGDRDRSSLGDAIVVELVNRFPVAVVAALGTSLSPEFKLGLRELDNVRPLLNIPLWIHRLSQRTCPPPTRREVKRLWNQLTREFLRHPYVRSKPWFVRKVAGLLLRITWLLSFRGLARLAAFFQWRRGSGESYARHVLREGAFLAREARFFVYGHTHHYESVPLATTLHADATVAQIYFNTSTWRHVHHSEIGRPTIGGFQSYKVMTYAAFFTGNERGGASYEVWNGVLG